MECMNGLLDDGFISHVTHGGGSFVELPTALYQFETQKERIASLRASKEIEIAKAKRFSRLKDVSSSEESGIDITGRSVDSSPSSFISDNEFGAKMLGLSPIKVSALGRSMTNEFPIDTIKETIEKGGNLVSGFK